MSETKGVQRCALNSIWLMQSEMTCASSPVKQSVSLIWQLENCSLDIMSSRHKQLTTISGCSETGGRGYKRVGRVTKVVAVDGQSMWPICFCSANSIVDYIKLAHESVVRCLKPLSLCETIYIIPRRMLLYSSQLMHWVYSLSHSCHVVIPNSQNTLYKGVHRQVDNIELIV